MSGPLSPVSVPVQKQLKYTAGIANGSIRESAAFIDQTRKVKFLLLHFMEFGSSPHFSSKKVGFGVSADGTYWATVNEEISSCGTIREAMEMEEESSSVATAIQMEMAKAMETIGMD